MTGLELDRQLWTTAPRFPTILITAHGDPETFNQARRAGIAACLAKPLQEASLLEAIETNTRQPD